MLATESWNGHTFELRCQIVKASVRLWARADGGGFEFIEAPLRAAARSDFARQHPGSRWLPLGVVPFTLVDEGSIVACKAEFDVSLFPSPGCGRTCRYRVCVGDEQVATGEIAPKPAADIVVYQLVFGGFTAVLLAAIWLFAHRT